MRWARRAFWVLLPAFALGAMNVAHPVVKTSSAVVDELALVLLLLMPAAAIGAGVVAYRGLPRWVGVILIGPVALGCGLLALVVVLLGPPSEPEAVKTVALNGSQMVLYRVDGPAYTSAPWVHVRQEWPVLPGIRVVKYFEVCSWAGGEDIALRDDHTVVARLPACGRSDQGSERVLRVKDHVYF